MLASALNFLQIAAVLGAIALLMALAGLGVVMLLRHRLLASTIRVLEAVVSGRTDHRADPTAPGTAGRLARTVNELGQRLAELKEQQEQYRDNLFALLDHTNELVIATNEEDLVQMVSPAAARMLDRSPSAILGRPISDFFAQRDLLDLYRSAYSSTKPVSADLRLTVARRELLCHVLATTMYTGPRYRGTLLLMRDLTEIAQAVQMKTDFAANASHELRTPLALIRAAVETIHESVPDLAAPEPAQREASVATVRRCSDIIGSHVLRLQLLVQDLLDLSRTEDPRAVIRHERVDLVQVTDTLAGMFAPVAAEKNIALAIDLAPVARCLRGDERLLVLMLKNLVDNALKFTPPGGHVTIRTYRAKESADSALASPPTPSLTLEVADTGIGIPKEDQQRVFERFYTVNRSRGGADRGTGLGLAIVKHAVAALGGIITLESEVNQGTTVRCSFPAEETT